MRTAKRLAVIVLACLFVLTANCGSVFAAQITDNMDEAADVLVNYLVVEEPLVRVPGKQTIMLGIGDDGIELESAVLSYSRLEDGHTYETNAFKILGSFVMFEMEFEDKSQAGSYRLDSITYTAEDQTYETSFSEMGIDAGFGVDQAVESEPDDVFLTDEEAEVLAAGAEMNIVALDEDGKPLSGETMEQALENAGCDVSDGITKIMQRGAEAGGTEDVDATGMRSIVVVLDAGHGGSDPGAQGNGIVEKTVNLKIAQYCKKELEEYSGITVYMTRTGDTNLTLAQRAQVAITKRADLFVSLHNNSNTSSGPNGANVYYPNSNYNSTCGASGKALASIIQSKLTSLGLANGGIHIRNSENGTKYPDGSLADYYGVIKRCKENGIPALIVEHAFVSNANDAKKFLSSDAQLKKLGVADASAIAEYYGLKKGLGFNSIESASSTTMDLTWSMVIGVTGYRIYRSTSSGSGFTEVAKITSANTTTWRDTGLTPGTTYYYKIRTYNKTSSGTEYGKYSAVASGTTMSTPSISSIRSKDSKTLVISWSTINNAANYELYRATKKNGTYTKIATLAGMNQLSYTDKVKAGKQYYYKIRSVGLVDNTTVYSDYSEIMPGRTAVIPKDVFVKPVGTTTLRVSWTADPNASGYVIKRADSAGGKFKKVGTADGGSTKYYDDATVKAQKTYYYKVQAFNHNSGIKGVSGFGKAASGKTIKKTSITKITNNSATSQTINWKQVSGVDGYVIYQATSKNGKYKKVKTVSGNKKTSYKVTGLTAGTHYYYKVRTRKKVNGKVGYGSYSAIRNVWTLKPAEITSVQGSTGNKIQILWSHGGAEYYNIYRSETSDGSFSKIATVKGNQSSYTDTDLNMTQTYFYKIEAFVKGYKTAEKNCGMSAAAGGTPVSVTNISSVAANEKGQLEITWTGVEDVTGYQIYRSTELNGTYTLLQTISGSSVTSYSDASVKREDKDVTYYYKIALVNQYGTNTVYGQQSPAAAGTLPAAAQQTPAAP